MIKLDQSVFDHIRKDGVEFILTSPVWVSYISFLKERMKIWRRKELWHQAPPWTEDPVLRDAKIINIYRELDRNSRYELSNIIQPFEDDPVEQVRRIILFRHTNSPWIYENLIAGITESQFKSEYPAANARGNGVSRAMLFNTPRFVSYADWVWTFYTWIGSHRDRLFSIVASNTAKDLFRAFDDIPGIGEFFAYEMYTSSTYCKWCKFTENDFLEVGPGAVPGLEMLMGLEKYSLGSQDAVALVKELTPIIKSVLLDDPDYVWIPKEYQPKNPEQYKFTLRTVEHSLCEWRKFYSVQHGLIPLRRRYEPKSVVHGPAQGEGTTQDD